LTNIGSTCQGITIYDIIIKCKNKPSPPSPPLPMNSKVETVEGVGVCSLIHSTSGVEGRVEAP